MSHIPHEITEEFPEYAARIAGLKQQDAHFARLLGAYEEINAQVHRAEALVEPTDDLHLTEMRKQRLALKDEIFRVLTQGG